MKTKDKILLGTAFITLGLIALSLLKEEFAEEIDTHKISEEGYETASDILYPSYDVGNKDLKYGPVFPS